MASHLSPLSGSASRPLERGSARAANSWMIDSRWEASKRWAASLSEPREVLSIPSVLRVFSHPVASCKARKLVKVELQK